MLTSEGWWCMDQAKRDRRMVGNNEFQLAVDCGQKSGTTPQTTTISTWANRFVPRPIPTPQWHDVFATGHTTTNVPNVPWAWINFRPEVQRTVILLNICRVVQFPASSPTRVVASVALSTEAGPCRDLNHFTSGKWTRCQPARSVQGGSYNQRESTGWQPVYLA